MIDVEEDDEKPAGGGWITTFADLMSLLMCFFVLLLSFSVMDTQKYKQLAGSLASAFGTQRVLRIETLPKASSVIKTQQQPGNPDNVMPRFTPQELGFEETQPKLHNDLLLRLEDQVVSEAKAIKKALRNEVKEGRVEVLSDGILIVVRITEKGSFSSGMAELDPKFLPVLDRLKTSLRDVKGQISVEGHTDDVPISTPRYRSNWELSASRAATVAHELLKDEHIDANRISVAGFGSTKKLIEGTSPQARARNRRVEVVIRRMDELVGEQTQKAGREAHDKHKDTRLERAGSDTLLHLGGDDVEKGTFNRPRIDPAMLDGI